MGAGCPSQHLSRRAARTRAVRNDAHPALGSGKGSLRLAGGPRSTPGRPWDCTPPEDTHFRGRRPAASDQQLCSLRSQGSWTRSTRQARQGPRAWASRALPSQDLTQQNLRFSIYQMEGRGSHCPPPTVRWKEDGEVTQGKREQAHEGPPGLLCPQTWQGSRAISSLPAHRACSLPAPFLGSPGGRKAPGAQCQLPPPPSQGIRSRSQNKGCWRPATGGVPRPTARSAWLPLGSPAPPRTHASKHALPKGVKPSTRPGPLGSAPWAVLAWPGPLGPHLRQEVGSEGPALGTSSGPQQTKSS